MALRTKQEPDHVEYGMGMEAYDNEGRFIRCLLYTSIAFPFYFLKFVAQTTKAEKLTM